MTYGTEPAAGDASLQGRVTGGSAVARVFFVQMWKGSQNRSATALALPSATPEGGIIQ